MAKVTAYMVFPDIMSYDEEDENIEHCFVGTFDKCKERVQKETAQYLKRLDKLTYQEWKKTKII